MTKKVFLAGSTGSIGKQTLAICKEHSIEVSCISAHSNYALLAKQAKEFNIRKVHIFNSNYYSKLKELLPDTEVYSGGDALNELVYNDDSDTLVNAIVGSAGLLPTIFGIKSKKKIALANKETIVCAGKLVMELAEKNGVTIFPVDSEHSAIFQCLLGNNYRDVKKIILTASGGPFFGKTNLEGITVADALAHPNWSMGRKISIDSATLMNKGLEVIEAYHLFKNRPIEVVVHRESIIHSMVEYIDNAIMAQLGTPDMTIPIQLALTYPDRFASTASEVDFIKLKTLSFFEPDIKTFRCLDLAYQALKIGGTMPCVLNVANEVAVEAFLNEKIKFSEIPNVIEKAMEKHNVILDYTIEQILEIDKSTRSSECKV